MVQGQFRCPDCGDIMEFDSVEQWYVCPSCGNIVPVATANALMESKKEEV